MGIERLYDEIFTNKLTPEEVEEQLKLDEARWEPLWGPSTPEQIKGRRERLLRGDIGRKTDPGEEPIEVSQDRMAEQLDSVRRLFTSIAGREFWVPAYHADFYEKHRYEFEFELAKEIVNNPSLFVEGRELPVRIDYN